MKVVQTLWKKWQHVAKAVANFQAYILLTIFYIIIFSVLGIIFRFFKDPFNVRIGSKKRKTNFSSWQHTSDTITTAQNQY